jgi:hypothetical protein
VLPCRFREWLYTRRVKPARISLLLLLSLSALWIRCALAQPAPAQTGLPVSPPLPNLLLLQELETPGPVSALVWSSDGTKLAVGSVGQPSTVPIIPPMRLANVFGMLITIWRLDGRVDQQIRRTEAFFVRNDTFAFVGGNRLLATPRLRTRMPSHSSTSIQESLSVKSLDCVLVDSEPSTARRCLSLRPIKLFWQ